MSPDLTPAEHVDRAWIHALPKAELHVHLDGSLRPETLVELAHERGVALPAGDDRMGEYMLVSDAASLEEYLERFSVTLSVMQDAVALERIAYECMVDHEEDGVRYVELRFCPVLNMRGGNLSANAVVEAALAGMRRAETERNIRGNLILCGLRSMRPEVSLVIASLAVAYRDRGVCAFDIAGAEAGHPVSDHVRAFDYVHSADLPATIHAGEGFGPASIRQALEVGRAARIGHGTRLFEDPELLAMVRDRGIPLEVCLTSNVQTGVVESVATHPARDYLEAGIPVSLGTDNRLMSGVTLTDEYDRAARGLGLDRAALVTIARTGFEHAFVSEQERAEMLNAYDLEVGAQD